MGKEISRDQNIDTGVAASQEATFTPQEIGFIKEAKRIIGQHLTRTILVVSAVLAGTGIIVAEKSGSFDPLDSRVDSAKHLVLNNLHKSYEQLIDTLPEVEKAEATPPDPVTWNPSLNPLITITNGNCEPEKIDFTPHSTTMHVGDHLAFTVDACLNQDLQIFFKLVEVDGASDDTLDRISVSTSDIFNGAQTVGIKFYLDCVDGFTRYDPNRVVGAYSYSQDFDSSADLAVEIEYDPIYPDYTNYTDNVGADTGVAKIKCLDVGCSSGSGSGTEIQDGNTAAGSCSGGSVGGILEEPDVESFSQDIASEKNPDYTVPITAGLASAVAAVTIAGAAFYTNRKRSSK